MACEGAFGQATLSVSPYGTRLNHLLQVWRGSFAPKKIGFEFLYQCERVRDFGVRKGGLGGATVVEIGPGWDLIGCLIF